MSLFGIYCLGGQFLFEYMALFCVLRLFVDLGCYFGVYFCLLVCLCNCGGLAFCELFGVWFVCLLLIWVGLILVDCLNYGVCSLVCGCLLGVVC